jgi:hypothetical protein
MRTVILVAAAAAFAFACSSPGTAPGTPTDENTHDNAPDPSSGNGDQNNDSPPPLTGQDAGKPPPPPPPPPTDGGVTKTDGGGADAGDPTAITSLFPAKVGHTMTFQVSSDFPQCSGERTGSVLGTQKVDGRDAFWISSYCDGQPPAAVSVSDKSADVDVQGQYIPQLAAPVAEGAKFQSISGTSTWHKEGTVTVPAGTFQNCWRSTSGNTFVIYCPGVGTVHIHEDHGNGVIDALLKSKNY